MNNAHELHKCRLHLSHLYQNVLRFQAVNNAQGIQSDFVQSVENATGVNLVYHLYPSFLDDCYQTHLYSSNTLRVKFNSSLNYLLNIFAFYNLNSVNDVPSQISLP